MLYPIEPELDEKDARAINRRPWVPKSGQAPAGVEPASIRAPMALAFIRDPGSLVAMAVMTFVFYMQIVRHGLPPSLPNAFTAALIGGAIFLFAVRREPTRKGNALGAILAIVGTFCIAFMPPARSHYFAITLIQIAGSALWLWALIGLGRSFGLAPADRGLKTRGPYRFLRHPMYAGEFVNVLGAVIAVATPAGVAIFAAWWLFQVLRIIQEEKVIAGYSDYTKNVHWRVLPGVW